MLTAPLLSHVLLEGAISTFVPHGARIVERSDLGICSRTMQNRSNRTLLFGGRAGVGGDAAGGGSASAADIEEMEAENQGGVDALRGSAGLMKDVRKCVNIKLRKTEASRINC